MTEIILHPLDGGDHISVPNEKTIVGRGPFLQVQDKRVSRNHGTLEIIDGKLVLVPIHTNPCFYKANGEGSQVSLPKDKAQILNDSDVFGLLPDKLFYKVVYKNASAKEEKKNEEEECSDTEEDDSDVEKETNHKDTTPTKPTPVSLVKSNGSDDIALPLEKKRELPKWMVGSSNRVDVSPSPEKSPAKTKIAENARPAKTSEEPKKKSPKGKGRPRGTAMASDDEFAGLSGDDKPKKGKRKASETPTRAGGRAAAKKSYTEFSDEDFEDEGDFSEEEQVKPKMKRTSSAGRGRGRGRGRPRKPRSESEGYSGEDDSEDVTPSKKAARRPRAASLKSPGYNDDYVLSDEDFFPEEEDDAAKPGRASDSDFVPGDESDDDWANKKYKRGSLSPRGRGRGRGRGGSPGRRRGRRAGRPSLIRNQSKRRAKDSDEEFEDSYKPRPTKRRAASTQKKYRDRDNSEEESEFSEEEPPKKANRRKKESEDENEDDNDNVEEKKEKKDKKEKKEKKISRKSCTYGKKCYRKNPSHFKEFCHPGDDSYEEEAEEEEEEEEEKVENKGRRRPKRATAGKKSLLQGASDDDGETNTYDRNDSFLDDGTVEGEHGDSSSPFDANEDDSDFEPPEEDIERLKKEAKGFLKNKKMVKPVKRK